MLEEIKYQENIKKLRNEILEKRNEFDRITEVINNTMYILNGLGDVSMVTIEDLKSIAVNQLVVLTDKVSFIKLNESDSHMHFITHLKAGGKYGIHSHDCNEYTTVLKGNLIELLDNNKIYYEGETVVYLEDCLHEPSCSIDSEYSVIFRKTGKNIFYI